MIACNLRDPTPHSAVGALAYVGNPNRGSGGERVDLVIRSRGGRWIGIWQPASRLRDFRFKTLPAEHPRHADQRIADWATEDDLRMLRQAAERL